MPLRDSLLLPAELDLWVSTWALNSIWTINAIWALNSIWVHHANGIEVKGPLGYIHCQWIHRPLPNFWSKRSDQDVWNPDSGSNFYSQNLTWCRLIFAITDLTFDQLTTSRLLILVKSTSCKLQPPFELNDVTSIAFHQKGGFKRFVCFSNRNVQLKGGYQDLLSVRSIELLVRKFRCFWFRSSK